MAARKGQAPRRQAQAAEPAPVAAVVNAAPPEQAAPAAPASEPVAVTAASDAPAAVLDPAPLEPLEEAADDLGRFPVLSPLRFDGRRYRPDDPDADEVVMPRDQATALQDIDVLGEELT